MSNLKYYFEMRAPDLSKTEIDAQVARVRAAHAGAPSGTANWKLKASAWKIFAEIRSEDIWLFTLPEYFQSLFPRGEIRTPVEPFSRQHCCVITKGKTDG